MREYVIVAFVGFWVKLKFAFYILWDGGYIQALGGDRPPYTIRLTPSNTESVYRIYEQRRSTPSEGCAADGVEVDKILWKTSRGRH